MAAAAYPSFLSYRADLVTELVPGAMDLVEALFGNVRKGAAGAGERQEALRAAGKLVSSLARAGIHHRDLHAGNILLQWHGSAPQPYLLDLDRCKVGLEGSQVPVDTMARRLRRSLAKWERRTSLLLSEREWSALDRALEA
jgi:tRNA A-37 threonylcarbamoyl transferase component Bud32